MGSAYPLSVSTVHPLFRIWSAISDLKETSGKAIFSLQTVGIETFLGEADVNSFRPTPRCFECPAYISTFDCLIFRRLC